MSLKGIIGCSGVRLKPSKYRNSEACNQDNRLDDDLCPVLDRLTISTNNPLRPACKRRIEVRDFSFDKTIPKFTAAIEAQIDCDDTSDDFIKKKMHSNIRSNERLSVL